MSTKSKPKDAEDCDVRTDVLTISIFKMIDGVDICPYHTMIMTAAIMSRSLFYALPDEYVCDAIDRAAEMAKSMARDNMHVKKDLKREKAQEIDIGELMELLKSKGVTRH